MKDFFDLIFLSHEFDLMVSCFSPQSEIHSGKDKQVWKQQKHYLNSNLDEQASFQRLWDAFKSRTDSIPDGFQRCLFRDTRVP